MRLLTIERTAEGLNLTYDVSDLESSLTYELYQNDTLASTMVAEGESTVTILITSPVDGDVFTVRGNNGSAYTDISYYTYMENTHYIKKEFSAAVPLKETPLVTPMYLKTTLIGAVPEEVQNWGGINLSLEKVDNYNRGFEEGFLLGTMM